MKPQSLRQRAGNIKFDDLDTTAAESGRAAPDGPRTGPGAISASLAMGREIIQENDKLKAKLARFEDAQVIELLDPQEIGYSEFANRDVSSFSTPEYAALKKEIESAGRNVVPIKVRAARQTRDRIKYEIIFGHRRHRACSELGFPVRAIVENTSDEQLVAEMERENRTRSNLSAWEQGMFYAKVLDKKIFASIRQLADHLGVDYTVASRAVQLASLPPQIVAAFPSPLDLQYRWAAPLHEAVNGSEEAVFRKAGELAALPIKPTSKEVFQHLVSAGGGVGAGVSEDFSVQGKGVVATWVKSRAGASTIKIKPGALNAESERRLKEMLVELLSEG